MKLTQEILKELLHYDPHTGVFSWKQRDRKWFSNDLGWKKWNTRYSGKDVGYNDSVGYTMTSIFDKKYRCHRLAFVYMLGYFPKFVDHIDHNRLNNKWCNLREVTKNENEKNQSKRYDNTSGVTGVVHSKRTNKWFARINVDNKTKHLGSFKDFEAAVEARKEAEKKYGYHENHGVKQEKES